MQTIPDAQVRSRIAAENPWWDAPHQLPEAYAQLPPRAYFDDLHGLVAAPDLRRAVILMGPRRVGKTVLLHHLIGRLIADGFPARAVVYCAVDHPLYTRRGLAELVALAEAEAGMAAAVVVFDEVQYLGDWELHLKRLVDDRPDVRWVASGSAAAALRLKSTESGAGRFTDFLLPPLTFHEFLTLTRRDALLTAGATAMQPVAADAEALDAAFIDYVNFGGYPEVALSPLIRADPQRFIKGDIIDKVLLRDLPSLYGISDIPELNHLFTTLAYNTGQEVSIEGLAKSSGVAKNTLRRYIDYLEAAFLVRRLSRIDRSGKRFQRESHFKVYLTNPSMRAALFDVLDASDPAMGAVVETAGVAQWFHHTVPLHYARWRSGEVDLVRVDAARRVTAAYEIKWGDAAAKAPARALRPLLDFARAHGLREVTVTSRRITADTDVDGVLVRALPTAVWAYRTGKFRPTLRGMLVGMDPGVGRDKDRL